MIPKKQRTLKHEAVISGPGYHSKEKCLIRILPAAENTGVVFIGKQGMIAADYFSIAESFANTSLHHCNFIIAGVEHLMSALYGMFIDNAEIEVFGGLPMGDGSPLMFCKAIKNAGAVEQDANRKFLEITRAISVEDNGSFISIVPSDNYIISYRMGNPYPKAVHGNCRFILTADSYSEISKARTWGEQKHITQLNRMGAKGLDRSTCLILNNGKFSQKLRYGDEPVRHKVVDCLGDLSLLFGMYIKGEVVAFNAGHKLHHELMKGIINDPSNSSNRQVQYS